MAIHPATSVAIDKFGELLRVERLFDTKKQELEAAMSLVPEKDMNFYVAETEQMRAMDQQIRDRNHLPAGA